MPFDDIRRQGPGRGSYERAINLPPALLWLIGINVAVHLLRQTLSDAADDSLVLSLEKVQEFRYVRRFGHPIILGTMKSLDEVVELLAQ